MRERAILQGSLKEGRFFSRSNPEKLGDLICNSTLTVIHRFCLTQRGTEALT